jgi:polyhydroxyalkanoate synthesis repressor PhaR
MVRENVTFEVFDAKSGEKITHAVLTQIIFEEETKGQNLLPIDFLRKLIRLYGDSMQSLVPSYLEHSMNSLMNEQEKFRDMIAKSIGSTGIDTIDDQVRQNMAMFQQAFSMFSPFKMDGMQPTSSEPKKAEPKDQDENKTGEMDELRKQLSDMQQQLNKLSKK